MQKLNLSFQNAGVLLWVRAIFWDAYWSCYKDAGVDEDGGKVGEGGTLTGRGGSARLQRCCRCGSRHSGARATSRWHVASAGWYLTVVAPAAVALATFVVFQLVINCLLTAPACTNACSSCAMPCAWFILHKMTTKGMYKARSATRTVS